MPKQLIISDKCTYKDIKSWLRLRGAGKREEAIVVGDRVTDDMRRSLTLVRRHNLPIRFCSPELESKLAT